MGRNSKINNSRIISTNTKCLWLWLRMLSTRYVAREIVKPRNIWSFSPLTRTKRRAVKEKSDSCFSTLMWFYRKFQTSTTKWSRCQISRILMGSILTGKTSELISKNSTNSIQLGRKTAWITGETFLHSSSRTFRSRTWTVPKDRLLLGLRYRLLLE